jgi:hypothetical protein
MTNLLFDFTATALFKFYRQHFQSQWLRQRQLSWPHTFEVLLSKQGEFPSSS